MDLCFSSSSRISPSLNHFAVLRKMDSLLGDDNSLNNSVGTSYDTNSKGASLRSTALEDKNSVLNSPVTNNFSFLPVLSSNPNLTLRNTSPAGEFDIGTDIYFQKNQKWQKTSEKALLDSGAVQTFVDKKWVTSLGIFTKKLSLPRSITNTNGTSSSHGTIMDYVSVVFLYQGHSEEVNALVTNLGTHRIYLGYDWFQCHNPLIDWVDKEIKFCCCMHNCVTINTAGLIKEVWNPAICSIEEGLAEKVPKQYHEFLNVFSKEESKCMPICKPWDHAIDLKPNFVPKKGQVIPLSDAELEKVRNFINSEQEKGYICPSKSPQTALVFFIPKKTSKKWLIMDYWYLNEGTVKNSYPLPLISALVNHLKGADKFTCLNLRWGYNNVYIKEGHEWKAMFITPLEAYEPVVMYFGMTNSADKVDFLGMTVSANSVSMQNNKVDTILNWPALMITAIIPGLM
jgi:hypothetical protein